jgi:energy-coupling factor transporter ATP-binding protein EcfA2
MSEEVSMRLESVKYSEFRGTEQEWTLEELRLGDRNLVVGKNATGKSRVLNIISSLAGNLAGVKAPGLSAHYEVAFSNDGRSLIYELKYEQGQVVREKFKVEEKVLLNRGGDGEGTIWADELKEEIRFQTPPSQLAAVARRDTIQHIFLEPLHDWASSLRHYYFGSPLGKDNFAVFVEKGAPKFDERDPNAVVALYRQADKEYEGQFKDAIISDMRTLDYDIADVGLRPPLSIRFAGLPGELVGLYLKERDLPGITDQHSMSQGMFRALSILVQVNYSRMAKKATCILIDDIGEGLDFERSCRLIDLLRKRAEESSIQLILSTNDRFVMNHVPLEEWSFLQRQGGHVRVRNYENSRDVFDEFKFLGLSNFSFLELDFISSLPAEEAAAHE